MATKAKGCSCYEKAAPDEPIFVLRAKDPLAPLVVRMWAEIAAQRRVNSEKVVEARLCAIDMEGYAKMHFPDRKNPD